MSDSETRNRGGRPQFVPSDAQRQIVTVLHAHGISHKTIARRIFHQHDIIPNSGGRPRPGAKPIAVNTLEKHFREELIDAHEMVKASMIQTIVTAASRGAWGAARFWLATQGGAEWRIPTGDNDAAIALGNGGTIIIRGGLPPIYQAGEDDDQPVNGNGSNGGGNGHAA